MSRSSTKRGDQGEEMVAKILQSDSKYHRLINNLMLASSSGITHQSDHILIRENGIFCIETKNYYGTITGSSRDLYWNVSQLNKRRMIVKKLHNPIMQNQSHIRSIGKLFKGKYQIHNYIVFVQNNSGTLCIPGVINLNSLMHEISATKTDTPLSRQEIDFIYNTLLDNEAYANQKDHLENIKKIKIKRNEFQKEATIAIEQRKCPKCGEALIDKNGALLCPACHYKLKF